MHDLLPTPTSGEGLVWHFLALRARPNIAVTSRHLAASYLGAIVYKVNQPVLSSRTDFAETGKDEIIREFLRKIAS